MIYAYGLSDVLSAFLVLISLWLFVRKDPPDVCSKWGSFVAMVGALLSKQSAVITPFLIMAFDFAFRCELKWPRLRSRLSVYALHFMLMGTYLLARFLYFGSLGDLEAGERNVHEGLSYVLSQPAVILSYLGRTLVPVRLAIDHHLGPKHFSSLERMIGLGVFLVLVYWVVRAIGKPKPASKVFVFCVLFFVVALAPTSSIFPTVDVMVERRVYMANAGLFMFFAFVLDRVCIGRKVVLVIVTLYLVLLAGVSVHRNSIFHTIKFQPIG